MEALQRFFDALTEQDEARRNKQPIPTPQPRMTAKRRKQIEAAAKRLADAGI